MNRPSMVIASLRFKPTSRRNCDSLDHRTLTQTQSPLLQVRRRAQQIEIRYRRQKIILPRQAVLLLPLANTSTELLAEHVANRIRVEVQDQFRGARIRSVEVGVEEA